MFRRIDVGAVVLPAMSGVLGWLAASGRLAETFGQDTKAQPAAADRTQLPKPDPAFKGKIGESKIRRTFFRHGLEPFEVGRDSITPVSPDYKTPFAFTGTIDKITFESVAVSKCGLITTAGYFCGKETTVMLP